MWLVHLLQFYIADGNPEERSNYSDLDHSTSLCCRRGDTNTILRLEVVYCAIVHS